MIATYAEVRQAVMAAADVLTHPYKADRPDQLNAAGQMRKRGGSHPYGSTNGTVVYREGGEVGVCSDGRYLVARGKNHEASVYGLAYALGLTVVRRKEDGAVIVPDVGVQVDEVDAGHFWLFCLPEGYALPEG